MWMYRRQFERDARLTRSSANAASVDPDEEEEHANSRNRLASFFWMTARQVVLAQRYPHVLIQDNTYKCVFPCVSSLCGKLLPNPTSGY
jgi:hypothetical protein